MKNQNSCLSFIVVVFMTLMTITPVRAAPNAEKSPPQSASDSSAPPVVNINTATSQELTRLPGIGVTKAQRIVEFRQRSGKFRRIKDLRRVKGLGYKSLKKLRPHLTLTGATTMK